MNLRHNASLLTTLCLSFGAIGVYRYSVHAYPKAPSKTVLAAQQRSQTREFPQNADPQAIERYLRARERANMETGALELSNASVAKQVGLSASNKNRIVQIAEELESETVRLMQGAMQDWRKRGAYQDGRTPNFLTYASDAQQRIVNLKRNAESQIAALLDESERTHWQKYQGITRKEIPAYKPLALVE